MERHFSTGVATIVALMAAHRAASGRAGQRTAFSQGEVARIDAYLNEDSRRQIAEAPHRTAGRRHAGEIQRSA